MNFNIGKYTFRVRFIDRRNFSCTNIYNFVIVPTFHLYLPIEKEKVISYRGFGAEWLKWGVLVYVNQLKIGRGVLDKKNIQERE